VAAKLGLAMSSPRTERPRACEFRSVVVRAGPLGAPVSCLGFGCIEVGRRCLARVVGILSGVRIRRRRKFLSRFREEEFCEHVGEAFARRSPLHILVGA